MSAKLWAIVKREYLERVRTKSFVIGTILGPLLMAGMMIVPALAARSKGKPLRIAVVDATGELRDAVETALREAKVDGRARFDVQPAPKGPAAEAEAALKQAVLAGQLDGYLALPAEAVSGANVSYYASWHGTLPTRGARPNAGNGCGSSPRRSSSTPSALRRASTSCRRTSGATSWARRWTD